MNFTKEYEIYSKLVKIRLSEERIIEEYKFQKIRTPVHLSIGEEGIAAGVSCCLNESDYVVSNHRCHGHALAKGMDLESFFLELYGKQGGCTRGWGGSMHLSDMSQGIIGTSAIVAGGISIGAGTAMTQKIEQTRGISVIYFGDGAVDEGVFWETVNFSALHRLPILFVMEDNGYASQTSASMRHAYKDIGPIIEGFRIPVISVEGNDAWAVFQACQKVLPDIRGGKGPVFLNCTTYRWLGHVGPVDDTASGYRSEEEVTYWRKKCPVKKMREYLKEIDPLAEEQMKKIEEEWLERVELAVSKAKEAPYAVD